MEQGQGSAKNAQGAPLPLGTFPPQIFVNSPQFLSDNNKLQFSIDNNNHQSESIFSTCPYLSQVSAPVLIENLCKERKKTCLLPLSHHLHRSFFFTILTGHIYVTDHIFQIFFPQFHCYYPNHELLVNEKTLMLASTPSCGKFSAKNLEVSFS